MNFKKVTAISSLNWWREENKVVSPSILKATSKISKIPGKTSRVQSPWEALYQLPQLYLLFKMKLLIIQKELQTFLIIFSRLSAKRPKWHKILIKKWHWLSHKGNP